MIKDDSNKMLAPIFKTIGEFCVSFASILISSAWISCEMSCKRPYHMVHIHVCGILYAQFHLFYMVDIKHAVSNWYLACLVKACSLVKQQIIFKR